MFTANQLTKLLIYLILFISDCLSIIAATPSMTKNDATRQLSSHAVDAFALPGDANFPLSSLYGIPSTRADAGAFYGEVC